LEIEAIENLMVAVLHHPDASVRIERTDDGRKYRLSVEPKDGLFVPARRWETAYPLDLIEHVLRVKGPAYLCDEIRRDEDPLYVQHCFKWDILSYVGEDAFAGRRVLDFGSGSGASSMVLARLLPSAAELVGVELAPDYVELARHRARFYGVEDRVSFRLSADASTLPADIEQFDYIVLSAVYEHLVPDERRSLLPLLWRHLRPRGVIFVDQTPYRWFPIEMHTTGLPLINYLPDRLTLACARRFSKRVGPDVSWPELMRRGIRGGTTREIIEILNRDGWHAKLLKPSRLGVRDDIDLWYQFSRTRRKPRIKKLLMWGFRAIKATTGLSMVPTLSLAIQKVR
jgi:2-polyprenyl-3-methyl-5-hydroxy-6-metoxy-1,4-benzoquinol methylase